MIDEFKNLIHTPKKSLSALFAHTQNTVLFSFIAGADNTRGNTPIFI